MASVELETVHWDRVDSVFDEGTSSVPHYNYRIPSRETLGSANLEVFVEEETELADGVERSSSGVTSPPSDDAEMPRFRGDSSSGSTSSTGLKSNSFPREELPASLARTLVLVCVWCVLILHVSLVNLLYIIVCFAVTMTWPAC